MAIFKDFLDKLFLKSKDGKTVELNAVSVDMTTEKELWAYRLALNIIAERYGALLSKCEFRTFVNGKEEMGDNYYLLNYEPNPNQTAAEFKKQIIYQLIMSPNHDCLIVQLDDVGNKKQAFYVADDFTKDGYQLRETYFKNVSVNIYGDTSYPVQGVFSGSKAIYFKYQNAELDAIFDLMRQEYCDLISNAEQSGKYRQKFALELDQTAESDPNFDDNLQSLLDTQFSAFIKGDNGVIPLYAGMKLDTVSAGADLGQNASVANSTIDSQIDQILTKTGLAFNMPKSVMLGEWDEKAIEQLLTYSIDPIAKIITEAFNRKWYGQKAVMDKKTYCQLDTSRARHYDVATMSEYMDKSISSGGYTINELRRLTNDPPIDAELGDVHFITKNYISIGNYLKEGASNDQGNS